MWRTFLYSDKTTVNLPLWNINFFFNNFYLVAIQLKYSTLPLLPYQYIFPNYFRNNITRAVLPYCWLFFLICQAKSLHQTFDCGRPQKKLAHPMPKITIESLLYCKISFHFHANKEARGKWTAKGVCCTIKAPGRQQKISAVFSKF